MITEMAIPTNTTRNRVASSIVSPIPFSPYSSYQAVALKRRCAAHAETPATSTSTPTLRTMKITASTGVRAPSGEDPVRAFADPHAAASWPRGGLP